MTSSNSSPSRKARKEKGTVQTKVSNGRLQLTFSWQKERYYLSMGLPDSPINRKGAERVARQIELDFVSGMLNLSSIHRSMRWRIGYFLIYSNPKWVVKFLPRPKGGARISQLNFLKLI